MEMEENDGDGSNSKKKFAEPLSPQIPPSMPPPRMDQFLYQRFQKEVSEDPRFRKKFISQINDKIEILKEQFKSKKIKRMKDTVLDETFLRDNSQNLQDEIEGLSGSMIESKRQLIEKLNEMEMKNTMSKLLLEDLPSRRGKKKGKGKRKRKRKAQEENEKEKGGPGAQAKVLLRKRIQEKEIDPLMLNLEAPNLVALYNFSQVSKSRDEVDAKEVVNRHFRKFEGFSQKYKKKKRKKGEGRLSVWASQLVQNERFYSEKKLKEEFQKKQERKAEIIKKGREIFKDADEERLIRLAASKPVPHESDIGIAERELEELRGLIMSLEKSRVRTMTQCEKVISKLVKKREKMSKINLDLSRENNQKNRFIKRAEEEMGRIKHFLRRKEKTPLFETRVREEGKNIERIETGLGKIIPFSEKLETERRKKDRIYRLLRKERRELRSIVKNVDDQVTDICEEIRVFEGSVQTISLKKDELVEMIEETTEKQEKDREELETDFHSMVIEHNLLHHINLILEDTIRVDTEDKGISIHVLKLTKLLSSLQTMNDDVLVNTNTYVDNIAYLQALEDMSNLVKSNEGKQEFDPSQSSFVKALQSLVHPSRPDQQQKGEGEGMVGEDEEQIWNPAQLEDIMKLFDSRIEQEKIRHLDEGVELGKIEKAFVDHHQLEVFLESLSEMVFEKSVVKECFAAQGYNPKDFDFEKLSHPELQECLETQWNDLKTQISDRPSVSDRAFTKMDEEQLHSSPQFFFIRKLIYGNLREKYKNFPEVSNLRLTSCGCNVERINEERDGEKKEMGELMSSIMKTTGKFIEQKKQKILLRVRMRRSRGYREFVSRRRDELKELGARNAKNIDPLITINLLEEQEIEKALVNDELKEQNIDKFSPAEIIRNIEQGSSSEDEEEEVKEEEEEESEGETEEDESGEEEEREEDVIDSGKGIVKEGEEEVEEEEEEGESEEEDYED